MLPFVLTFALEAPNPAGDLAHHGLGCPVRLARKGHQALVTVDVHGGARPCLQCVPGAGQGREQGPELVCTASG